MDAQNRDEILTDGVARAIGTMNGLPPDDLREVVNFHLRKRLPDGATEADIVRILTDADVNHKAKTAFRIQLAQWDADPSANWLTDASSQPPKSESRRVQIYQELKLSSGYYELLDAEYPRDLGGATVIFDEQDWEPWYTPERANAHDFYRAAYRRVLEAKWNDSDAIAKLDSATDEVVKRLADPERLDPYQSKGLVVGHVQSGKTANFTGVIAKAIDAGYRLVIVLTGTVEMLRSQTQRRLDMELVGKQNILGGIEENDLESMASVDYYRDGDVDWLEGKFLSHLVDPVTQDGIPGIVRLTSPNWDYKRLLAGLSALDFRGGNSLFVRSKALYDPENLYRTDVRLAVVKKNKDTLEKLVSDLKQLRTDLGEVPALIIDDEADQASINTMNPRKKGDLRPDPDRTAINKKIVELLKRMPRCQYIGYTATPFANVFVDPDNSEDVFPKDFIISLDRPASYMGGTDFHDFEFDGSEEEKSIANSNEKAYVRGLSADTPEARNREMQHALDAFVLSGAIKLFRESRGAMPYGHHTMLVHESVKQDDHRILANEIIQIWYRSGYSSTNGLARLKSLWESDFLPVSQVRAGVGDAIPVDFGELTMHIGRAVDKISSGAAPVIVVNGASERDYEQEALDFQAHDVWKILVGGTKLSRGFTVEGLTVSYYTRRTLQADTLMQMGRWFGFRSGYRDLVRLYIGRNVPGPREKRYDLYEAFGAVIRDEDDFREQLKKFSYTDEDGHPTVKPIDVPPLVYQQLPWLKPTGANKMYNAELTTKGAGGDLADFPMQADRGDGRLNAQHFAAVQPLLEILRDTGTFQYVEGEKGRARVGRYTARYGVVSAEVVIGILKEFHWAENWDFGPHAEFIRRAIAAGTLTDFAILLPELAAGRVRRLTVGDWADLPVGKRTRRNAVATSARPGFSGSSFRQRHAIEHIAGNPEKNGGPLAESLYQTTRGALLLTFAADMQHGNSDPMLLRDPADPRDVATLFSYALPKLSAPNGRVGFRAKKKGGGLIVENR